MEAGRRPPCARDVSRRRTYGRLHPLLIGPVCLAAVAIGSCRGPDADASVRSTIRLATFNIQELSTRALTSVDEAGRGLDPQASASASIVQAVRPDILILNEIDLDWSHPGDLSLNARRFAASYLGVGPDSIHYPYAYAAPSNTGLLSGIDLNGDGVTATDGERGTREHGDDSYGYGTYPGQYAMAVLSRFPIDSAHVRTFQRFRWADLPGNHMPEDHYSPEAEAAFRLSSKSHWDVPVSIGTDTLHLWVSHPTPPAFDGPEDRNGRRNFDEIRFWVLYMDGDARLVDDDGHAGGYGSSKPFVIAGDLNARPADPDVVYDGVSAIDQLLSDPRLQDSGPPGARTAVWNEGARVDYVLPSVDLRVMSSGVFDPDPEASPEGARRAGIASDHRLVWVDINWPPGGRPAGER